MQSRYYKLANTPGGANEFHFGLGHMDFVFSRMLEHTSRKTPPERGFLLQEAFFHRTVSHPIGY